MRESQASRWVIRLCTGAALAALLGVAACDRGRETPPAPSAPPPPGDFAALA